MTRTPRLLACMLAVALVPAGCGHDEAAVVRVLERHGGGPRHQVQATTADGRELFALRIDSDVLTILRSVHLGDATEESHLVITGIGPGEDQRCVRAFDATGGLRWRHRPARQPPADLRAGPGAAPFPHTLLAPSPDAPTFFSFGGRSFMAIATTGLWGPYSIEILELQATGGPSVRCRIWHPGNLRTPVVSADAGRMAFWAVNNQFRSAMGLPNDAYPYAVAVLRLDHALGVAREGETAVRFAPRLQRNGDSDSGAAGGLERYFVLPETWGPGHNPEIALELDDGLVRAHFPVGLTYVLDPAGGGVEVAASTEFARDHAARCETDPSLPALASLLDTKAHRVIVLPDR